MGKRQQRGQEDENEKQSVVRPLLCCIRRRGGERRRSHQETVEEPRTAHDVLQADPEEQSQGAGQAIEATMEAAGGQQEEEGDPAQDLPQQTQDKAASQAGAQAPGSGDWQPAASQSGAQASGCGGWQPAWTGPEDIWLDFIKSTYPKLHCQTNLFPPFHFNRTPHKVEKLAGQVVQVTANPDRSAGGQQVTGPAPAQVAGQLYMANPPDLEPVHVQDSDTQDDSAQAACLQALSKVSGQSGSEIMMVISELKFKKYLDYKNNPQALDNPDQPGTKLDKPQLPGKGNVSSINRFLVDGECDIIVIHPNLGVMVGEIKGVGGSQFFCGRSTGQQNTDIAKKVKRAVDQLTKQTTTLRCLLQDLPTIRITRTVLLPNITAAQLKTALATSAALTQDLITCTGSVDVTQAIGRCLVKEYLAQPSGWWQNMWTEGPDPNMTATLFERLVCRFAGPATTVEIPTACTPRVVVRTLGEAVSETGLRFSTLSLTPAQVDLLQQHAQQLKQYLYLQGPPGTGKTIVLFLGALTSLRQGRKVVIVHRPVNKALAVLLKEQLQSFPEVKAASAVHIRAVDFDDRKLNEEEDVDRLKGELEGKEEGKEEGEVKGRRDIKVHIILDEVDWHARVIAPYKRWITAVHDTMPDAVVWLAGLRNRDSTSDQDYQLPAWVDKVTLREPLRTPPCVTAHVTESGGRRINEERIPPYSAPCTPQHAQGVARKLGHEEQLGHYRQLGVGQWRFYLRCEACAGAVSDVMKRELRVGQTGGPQCRDVWILRGDYCYGTPRDDDAFVQRLRKDFPVTVVETDKRRGVPRTEAGASQLALAAEDSVVVTDYRAVNGLERSVIFVLGGGARSDVDANSRSTSFVCQIE